MMTAAPTPVAVPGFGILHGPLHTSLTTYVSGTLLSFGVEKSLHRLPPPRSPVADPPCFVIVTGITLVVTRELLRLLEIPLQDFSDGEVDAIFPRA